MDACTEREREREKVYTYLPTSGIPIDWIDTKFFSAYLAVG